MSILKSLFSSGGTPPTINADTAEAPSDAGEVKPSPETRPAAPPTPAEVLADGPGALSKSQGGLHARTAAEQVGRRGNFAAILSAHKAGEAPAESPASVGALTRGKAFGPRQADVVQRVTGHPVTRAGLEAMYGSILPDANVFVTGVSQDRTGALEYNVNWMDNDGEVVGKLNRRMARHPDGDLELYSHGCWIEPSHRSRAISAAVMQREIEMLENLSDHPRTRLSLWAGGMRDPNNPKDFQPLGVYVWATMGYDCAQSHGRRSNLSRSGGKARCDHEMKVKGLREKPDFDLMKLMFGVWVDNAAERGQLPDDPEVLSDLKRAGNMCRNMWSLATLQVPGLEVDVDLGGKTSTCHVGKAFLLSEEAPRWEGVFYVNQQAPTFREIADDYCGPRVKKAVAAFEAKQTELAETLDGGDVAAKREALTQVGRSGDQRWVPALEAAIAEHPELADEARAALARVTGARLTDALGEQAQDSGRIIKQRLGALDLCLERDPGRREALLGSLVEAPATGSDFEIARAALNRLARGKNDPDRLLGQLDKLYDHALAAKERLDPVDQGGHARGKSFFNQKIETREAIVSHLANLPRAGAANTLERIAKDDPYWEVGALAVDALVRSVGAEDPGRALGAATELLSRARDRHEALRAERQGAGRDAAYKIDNLINRLSRVRVRVLDSMGDLRGAPVADALEAAMQAEPYWSSVGAALGALGKVSGEDDPARVTTQAEQWFAQAHDYAPLRQRAVDVVARQGTPEAGRALVRLAKREQDRSVLVALAEGLAGARVDGAADARETVHGRIEAIDEAERRAAEARRREMEARRGA